MNTDCSQCGGRLDYFSYSTGKTLCTECRNTPFKPIPKVKAIPKHDPDTKQAEKARLERARSEVIDMLNERGAFGATYNGKHVGKHNWDIVSSTGKRIKVFSNWDLARQELRRKFRKPEVMGERDFVVISIVSNDSDKTSKHAILRNSEFLRLVTIAPTPGSSDPIKYALDQKNIPSDAWNNWNLLE